MEAPDQTIARHGAGTFILTNGGGVKDPKNEGRL
jgi:hypothetical protein